MSRSLVATLSTANLLHNVQVIRDLVGAAKIIAMVKANAYGHGLRSVSLRLQDHIDLFGVASIDEAIILRNIGITKPIILMQGIFERSELELAEKYDLDVVFHTYEQITWLEQTPLAPRIFAWLKVDTGLGRLGFSTEELSDAYDQLTHNKKTDFYVRILSHFSCAAQKEHPLNQQQIEKFETIVRAYVTDYSFCNSAAIFNFKDQHYNYVRPGLALYGVSPLQDVSAQELNLKPVMTLKSALCAVRVAHKGSFVGYGATYECMQDMLVGIVPCGYADGYPFVVSEGMHVLIKGILCPVIGKIAMDFLSVDLRGVPDAQVGDAVTLWGEGLPVEDLARHTPYSPYVILSSVQNRVKFVWI